MQFCMLAPNLRIYCIRTGKSLSEALLFAEHGENMLCTKIVLNVRNNFCTQHALPRFEIGIFIYWTCNSMNNLPLVNCGLVDAKIRASDKDLPVSKQVLRLWGKLVASPASYACEGRFVESQKTRKHQGYIFIRMFWIRYTGMPNSNVTTFS